MNLQKFTLTDGSEISVKPIYAASIPKDRRDEAFQWLRDHEFGDLVKNNVTVTFGRGEDETAKDFIGFCGDPIPLDLFGAFISQRATIKRSK